MLCNYQPFTRLSPYNLAGCQSYKYKSELRLGILCQDLRVENVDTFVSHILDNSLILSLCMNNSHLKGQTLGVAVG